MNRGVPRPRQHISGTRRSRWHKRLVWYEIMSTEMKSVEGEHRSRSSVSRLSLRWKPYRKARVLSTWDVWTVRPVACPRMLQAFVRPFPPLRSPLSSEELNHHLYKIKCFLNVDKLPVNAVQTHVHLTSGSGTFWLPLQCSLSNDRGAQARTIKRSRMGSGLVDNCENMITRVTGVVHPIRLTGRICQKGEQALLWLLL